LNKVGLSAAERIARRAAKELGDGICVTLGAGLPARVAGFLPAGVTVIHPGGAADGPVDVAILGAQQVSEHGDLADGVGPTEDATVAGSTTDVVARARRVVVLIEHTAADGSLRLLRQCSLPLAGRGVVHRIVTELATLDVTPDGLLLREVAPGVSARDVQAKTEPTLRISPDLSTMTY
jgi:3-oxoacid CoA-transferase subunit B